MFLYNLVCIGEIPAKLKEIVEVSVRLNLVRFVQSLSKVDQMDEWSMTHLRLKT